ncbi:MAG TPA: phosphate/phosphite/phosphonate ABC transporter substrate-binding protein [Streptosporangiaceae bacterium]|nr:phosphate/phosphite/phosphonate ABC transporter substrate-binding protein [Streptosporangiaceae bacterium]
MKNHYRVAAVAGVVTLGLGLAACGSSNNSASGGSKPAACPTGTLTFGVEPYDNASTLIPAYQALATDLGHQLGCKVNLQITESYVAEILAMKNGKLDMGEFGPAGFVFASQQAGAVPLASFADSNGQLSSYTAGIWVKKGSPITNLQQLAGHTLALSSTGSTSGDWVPRYALIQAGVQNSVKTEYAGGHPESLQALLNGKVDAAEINSQEEASATAAHKFDPSQYTEIWKSQPIPNDPVCVSGTLSPAARAAIKNALLNAKAGDFTSGKTSISSELDFTPPANGKVMVPVTKAMYSQLFSLATALGLSSKDL